MKKIRCILFSLAIGLICLSFYTIKPDFWSYTREFANGYKQLGIPQVAFDYREYFNSIPTSDNIRKQSEFFEKQTLLLNRFDREKLNFEEQVSFDHIQYEIGFNTERVRLELNWVNGGRNIPVNGLKDIEYNKEWYDYFIKKFTSLNTSAEDIMQFGLSEVKRINEEITNIQIRNGFKTRESFYTFLKGENFYFNKKQDVLRSFAIADSTIRRNLKSFIGEADIPKVYPMEWAEAGPYTPPGIYLNNDENAYGKDVFQYNFYGQKYNKRTIDWIFIHEAIPGHHLQASFRKQTKKDEAQDLFLYPGNFEGWACYVEYEGKALGVYKDDYIYLGKWEWDLIRSARLVLETGIHRFGWTKEKALEFWKNNIYGQDELAEREITRVTNWPGQALSYKLGAKFIFDLKSTLKIESGEKSRLVNFHRCYLSFGMRPLPVIQKNLELLFKQMVKY